MCIRDSTSVAFSWHVVDGGTVGVVFVLGERALRFLVGEGVKTVAQLAHAQMRALLQRDVGIACHELEGCAVAADAHARFVRGMPLIVVCRMARALAGKRA